MLISGFVFEVLLFLDWIIIIMSHYRKSISGRISISIICNNSNVKWSGNQGSYLVRSVSPPPLPSRGKVSGWFSSLAFVQHPF